MTYSKENKQIVKSNSTGEIISNEFLKEIWYNAQLSFLNELENDLQDYCEYLNNKRKCIEYYQEVDK